MISKSQPMKRSQLSEKEVSFWPFLDTSRINRSHWETRVGGGSHEAAQFRKPFARRGQGVGAPSPPRRQQGKANSWRGRPGSLFHRPLGGFKFFSCPLSSVPIPRSSPEISRVTPLVLTSGRRW